MHSHCCYLQNRGVAHTAKIGFASVTGTAASLFFSLSTGSVAELWLLLCYAVGEKQSTQLPVFSAHLQYSLGLVCKEKSTNKDKS